MDIFEQLLKLFGRDYWRMSNYDLWKLNRKYKLRVAGWGYDKDDTGLLDHSLFGPWSKRDKLIKKLIFRDKFASSFVAIVISIIAIVISAISILVAFFK